MDTNTENNETTKVPVNIRMDADLHSAIADLAAEEDRPVSNMVQRVLKRDPEIAQRLETSSAGAGA